MATIRVLHIWGTWCQPCKEELPVLKKIALQLRGDYGGDVQFIYVADALSTTDAMKKHMERAHLSMPIGLLFHDDENVIGRDLLGLLPQKDVGGGREESASDRQLSLPVTLLLDQNNVVRQAFVGSVLSRRADFVNGIEQLYRALAPSTHGSKAAADDVTSVVKKGRTPLL
jgi:thiol-disulfide isomerase/thioredoxin